MQGFQIAPDVGAAARQQQDAAFDQFWQNAHEAGNFVARWATSPIQAASLLGYRLAEGSAQGVTAPQRMAEIQQQYGGDWYAATRDPRMVAEALNFAGMLSLGPIATRVATRPLGSPEVAVPSRSHALYDPPTGQATPFAEIYPNGAVTDEAGRLIFDRDGRPIHPDAIVVGRRVGGGGSEAFPPGEYDALGTRITGRGPILLPRIEIDGDSGRLAPFFGPNGEYLGQSIVGVADDLDASQLFRHTAHEVAHAIDLNAVPPVNGQAFQSRQFGIRPPDPDMDIEAELYTIYRDLNNAPGASTTIWGPADLNYPRADWPAELWTEAIRAYKANPDYINRVAPNVARAIRDHVNTNPFLSKIIHFNAGGLPLPVGAPLPDTLQQVRLPGGSSVAPLLDLLSQAMLNAPPPAPRPPLGPAWAEEYHAIYQDPNSPEFAARVAREAQQHAERIEAERIEAERRWWEQAYAEGRAA
ncbi:MAG: hypothetical protein KIT43_10185 [Bauldia sp.]|nr:hypothetical protein [Bauldia sp.]